MPLDASLCAVIVERGNASGQANRKTVLCVQPQQKQPQAQLRQQLHLQPQQPQKDRHVSIAEAQKIKSDISYLLLLKATTCRIRGMMIRGSRGRQSFSKDRGIITFL